MDLGIRGLTNPVEIGRGGFAVVYRAFQPTFERLVAVKVFGDVTFDHSTQILFERECRAIGRISGRRNILTVHDAGMTESGRPYLIMAYIAGGSLEDRLQREGPMDWEEALAIGVKVAKALAAAHDAGVLHRDVKPANILMAEDGEPELADFGIARLADVTHMTRSRLSFTPLYVAPEVLGGAAPTPSIDIYSLASTIFALIAGRPAFGESGEDSLFVVMRRVETAPVPDLLRAHGVPDVVRELIEQAMAKDPSDRPPSAAAFAEALEAARQSVRHAAEAEARARQEAAQEAATQPGPAGSAVEEDDDDDDDLLAKTIPVGFTAVASHRADKGQHRGAYFAVVITVLVVVGALVFVLYPKPVGYAARVNGIQISQDSIDRDLSDIAANPKYVQLIDQPGGSGPVAGKRPGTYNPSFVAVLLDQQVRFEIIRQKLVAAKASPTPAQVDAAKPTVSQAFPAGVFAAFPVRYQTQLATQQAEADAFVKLETADLTGDGLNQYYQAHQIDYATEACVRHILIAVKGTSGQVDYTASLAEANRIRGLLSAGGDFAALAKQYSQDNQGSSGGSAGQGGVLTGSATDGCMTTQDLQQLVTEFARSVAALPLAQVSNPVKTQFGYHLIEVTKRIVEPLDEKVTSDIHQRVAGSKLNQLVAGSDVHINPKLGSFNNKIDPVTGQLQGVLPPPGSPRTSTTTSTSVPRNGSG